MTKRKTTPAAQRVALINAKRLSTGSALAQLQYELLLPDAKEAFNAWRMNPMTMLMLESLRELGVTPPAGYLDTDSIPTQYGVSSGLGLAHSFMSDPQVLYPHLFSGSAPGKPLPIPDTDYETDAASPARNGK